MNKDDKVNFYDYHEVEGSTADKAGCLIIILVVMFITYLIVM